MIRLARGAVLALLGALARASAHAADPLAAELADLSLEQLSKIQVTSVSRRSERLSDAAASIYVISSEDIRRSGATTLAEALRLAPNLQVARADANQWAIGARAFNSVITNKLLVLFDGRTVYSPLFSGVFWEAQDVPLEDIDRIEVISGPGGTLWGTNAVNGVINVITRPPRETSGPLVSGGAGDRTQFGSVRYGNPIAGADVRVVAKYEHHEPTERADGVSLGDESERFRALFRAEWGEDASHFNLQGGGYSAIIQQQALDHRKISGAHVLASWTRELGAGQSLKLQAYYDRTNRDQPGAIDDELDTYDVELQLGVRPWARHEMLWGAGYRYQMDRLVNVNPPALAFIPADQDLRYAHAFVEDDIALGERLSLILGFKLEHNIYTELEYLPTVRMAWKPTVNQLVWGALSRAVRAPARIDRELFVPGIPPHVVLAGGPNFESEVANVAELGYRTQPMGGLSYSITAFVHEDDHLRSVEPTPSGPQFENRIESTTFGAESWGALRVNAMWRVSAGVVLQDHQLRTGDSADNGATLGNDPESWWTIRNEFDFGSRVELDAWVRQVGALPDPAVPTYTTLDARFGWRVTSELELAVTGHDLLGSGHVEWGAPAARPEFERSVLFSLRWQP